MKPKKILVLIILILLGLFLATTVLGGNLPQGLFKPLASPSVMPSPTSTSKFQVCPDKWYKNEQPCIYRDSPSECDKQKKEYFIIDGERRELEEVDIEWVKKNCEVNKPEVVY